MAGKKTKQPDTKEKKPEAKKADAGGKAKKGNLKAKTPKKGKPHCSRSLVLVRGIGGYSRSAVYPKRPCTRGNIQQLNPGLKKKFLLLSQNQLVATRMVVPEWLNFTKHLDVILLKMCLESCWARVRNPSVSMWENGASITPATILIALTGRHGGKRVVFLKQRSSGFLLVTGPLSVNSVPLHRTHQKFVIATKVDYQWCENPQTSHWCFKQQQLCQPRHQEGEIFDTEKEKYKITEQGKIDRKARDSQILSKIKALPQLQGSLRCLLSPMGFVFTNWCSTFLMKNLIKQLIC